MSPEKNFLSVPQGSSWVQDGASWNGVSDVMIDLPNQGRQRVSLAEFWIRNPLHPAPTCALDPYSSQVQVPYTPAR